MKLCSPKQDRKPLPNKTNNPSPLKHCVLDVTVLEDYQQLESGKNAAQLHFAASDYCTTCGKPLVEFSYPPIERKITSIPKWILGGDRGPSDVEKRKYAILGVPFFVDGSSPEDFDEETLSLIEDHTSVHAITGVFEGKAFDHTRSALRIISDKGGVQWAVLRNSTYIIEDFVNSIFDSTLGYPGEGPPVVRSATELQKMLDSLPVPTHPPGKKPADSNRGGRGKKPKAGGAKGKKVKLDKWKNNGKKYSPRSDGDDSEDDVPNVYGCRENPCYFNGHYHVVENEALTGYDRRKEEEKKGRGRKDKEWKLCPEKQPIVSCPGGHGHTEGQRFVDTSIFKDDIEGPDIYRSITAQEAPLQWDYDAFACSDDDEEEEKEADVGAPRNATGLTAQTDDDDRKVFNTKPHPIPPPPTTSAVMASTNNTTPPPVSKGDTPTAPTIVPIAPFLQPLVFKLPEHPDMRHARWCNDRYIKERRRLVTVDLDNVRLYLRRERYRKPKAAEPLASFPPFEAPPDGGWPKTPLGRVVTEFSVSKRAIFVVTPVPDLGWFWALRSWAYGVFPTWVSYEQADDGLSYGGQNLSLYKAEVRSLFHTLREEDAERVFSLVRYARYFSHTISKIYPVLAERLYLLSVEKRVRVLTKDGKISPEVTDNVMYYVKEVGRKAGTPIYKGWRSKPVLVTNTVAWVVNQLVFDAIRLKLSSGLPSGEGVDFGCRVVLRAPNSTTRTDWGPYHVR